MNEKSKGMSDPAWILDALPTKCQTFGGLRRRQKVEKLKTARTAVDSKQRNHTHIARPCCFQGYGHYPRAHHQPSLPSRLLYPLCACRHQQPPAPPASPCAMPRTRLREPPTLQRTVQERGWVLRRVEVRGLDLLYHGEHIHHEDMDTNDFFYSVRLRVPVAYAVPVIYKKTHAGKKTETKRD